MHFNLLAEKLIRTNAGYLNLPFLLAAMTRGDITNFPALRPHQRPAWHMFLVQLATLALVQASQTRLPDDEDSWRAAIQGLTPAFPDDSPWHLVVDDGRKPAFMQPPVSGTLKWDRVTTPDSLDMLITSRNHDVKKAIARHAEPQDWLFALISQQTMNGYSGRGKYGIARMNGGSSSRVMMGLAPTVSGSTIIDLSAWWRRDVESLLFGHPGITKTALVWCQPWTEEQTLTINDLDRLFIEIGRRIRMKMKDGRLHAITAGSKKPRIEAREQKGSTRDPWALVHRVEHKALTLGERDWTYNLCNTLLYGNEWKIPELAMPTPGDANESMLMVFEAFARGNAKTAGFKSRTILIPRAVRRTMWGTQATDLAQEQMEVIDSMLKNLGHALALLAAGGDRHRRKKEHYAHAEPARRVLQATVDSLYFPTLFEKLAKPTSKERIDIHNDFTRRLARESRAVFQRHAPAVPCAQIMRPRAEIRSQAALESGIRKTFDTFGIKE